VYWEFGMRFKEFGFHTRIVLSFFLPPIFLLIAHRVMFCLPQHGNIIGPLFEEFKI